MSSMQLPIEALEAVVDQASDNIVSLRHLSLTCTTLLPRSRYHLFSSLVIRTVQHLEASPEFLDSCPWLAPLVRKVTLFPALRGNIRPNIYLFNIVPIHLLTRLPNLRAWTMVTGSSESVWLSPMSLHRFALRCYRKHSGLIRNLELSAVIFYSISDFRGLISAFIGLDSLTCYGIRFRRRQSTEQHPVAAGTVATSVRLLQISTLKICTSVGSCQAVQYLLTCSGSKLKHLVIQLRTTNDTDDHLGQLEQSITQFPRLSSLVVVISPAQTFVYGDDHFFRAIHSATTILKHVKKGCLADLRVEFNADPLANLGARLLGASEACKQLEEALLTFPYALVLVHDPVVNRRAGRAKFWSPIIRRAFSKLNERGLLAFKFTPSPEEDAPDPLGHENHVTCVAIFHNSARAVTCSLDGTIIVWDMMGGVVLQEWLAHQGLPVRALALSPDSGRLVSAGGCALVVWDIDSNAALKAAKLEGHTNVVNSCAWSPDGTLIASASLDRTVRIWDGHTFEQRDVLPMHPNSQEAQESLQFSPDARYLAWISGGTDCYVWRPLMGEQPKILRPHPDRLDVGTEAFSFDHESRRIATAHGNQNSDPDACVVRIWDAATGALVAVLTGHSKIVLSVSFSPDGRSLLSTDKAMSMWVWDCGIWSGEQTGVYGDVESLAFGWRQCVRADWKYVATGMIRGPVQIWRAGGDQCVATFCEHDSVVTCIEFSPNSQYLVSGDINGMVCIRCVSRFVGE